MGIQFQIISILRYMYIPFYTGSEKTFRRARICDTAVSGNSPLTYSIISESREGKDCCNISVADISDTSCMVRFT